MSRFANDDPVTRQSVSPTPIADDASSDTAHDVEAGPQRGRGYSWLRRSRKPSDKPKSEKAPDEVDFVEEVDGVWGKLGEGAPNYKNVSWIESSCFMINLQIGIGVLGLPATLAQIGLIPGIILILLSGIITTWADTVIGLFKKGHPEVYSVADVGGIMGGRFGRELFGSMYWLFCVLVGAGQVVAFSTAMNSITQHGACTIIWVLIGSAGGIVIGMYRTLDKIGWMQWVGLASLMGSLITAAAAAGIQDPPADISVVMVRNPGFLPGVQAGTNIILAFTGGPAFYNILSEMKSTKDFNKAVYWAQGFVTATYLIIAAVIYGFVGSAVASPALGSVGILMQRVCYGIILPGLVIGAVLYIHIPAKYVFVRALRNTRHLTESTWQHWTAWTGCVVGTGILLFLLANAIPVFNDLLTLISSLVGTPLAVTIPAAMWIWETRRTRPSSERGTKWWIGVAVCLIMIAVSSFITVAGTIAAVVSLNSAVQAGEAAPFSCADNS